LLRTAGIADTREIVTAYGAAAVLQMATTFSLPMLARYQRSWAAPRATTAWRLRHTSAPPYS
jgi:hypothetical protein